MTLYLKIMLKGSKERNVHCSLWWGFWNFEHKTKTEISYMKNP